MKSKQTKTIVISCIVILLVVCICLGVLLLGGVGVYLWQPFSFLETDMVTSPTAITPEQNDVITSTTEPSPTLEEIGELPEALAAALTKIELQVVDLRGLELKEPVEKTLISPTDLEEIVINDFFSEYTELDAQQDVLALSLLGLLPDGFDILRLYQELYSEQIAGFYDNETKEIYVVQGADFGGSEKLTYSHEFTHVLQDQTYGLDEGLDYNEEACERDSERCAAIQSLIEGDATLTELLWFQNHASRKDYLDLMESLDGFESPVFDSAPDFISADLYFPYEKGLGFVQSLYEEGGFEAVDGAYQNLPLSTEQILHPERYPEDLPQLVTLPDLSEQLGEGWEVFDENVMGEWYTFLILNKAYDESHRLPENEAQSAAEGWGGDAYAFYLNQNTAGVVFILDTVWDTPQDAVEFEGAFQMYADLRWGQPAGTLLESPTWPGEQGTSVFARIGNRTLWILAPTVEQAESILLDLR